MGLVYLPTNLPSKSTIHAGKYISVPWILYGPWDSSTVKLTSILGLNIFGSRNVPLATRVELNRKSKFRDNKTCQLVTIERFVIIHKALLLTSQEVSKKFSKWAITPHLQVGFNQFDY